MIRRAAFFNRAGVFRRMQAICPALCVAGVLAACSDQPSTAPRSALLANHAMIGVTLSDSSAAVGTAVAVSIDVQQPDTAASSAIAAFRARLAFDATGLQYLEDTPDGAGIHAVNVTGDTVRIAGAAPGAGFVGGRLITLHFRVLDAQGLRSLRLVLDEIRDLTYKDRRAQFAGQQKSGVQVVADAVPAPSSSRVYGDATGDGVIDAADVLAILTKDVGLTPPAGFDSVAADVNTDGVVNALDAQILLASLVGRDVLQFRIGDVVGSTRVTVTAIVPDTLRPGITATITGTNFSATAVNDTVMIDTIPAVITAATATQLTVSVPSTISCRATHGALVTVRAGGATGAQRQMLRVATQRSLQVGDSLVFDSDSAFRCNEFSAGIYFVAVYNSAREASTVPDSFQLVSTGATAVDGTTPLYNRAPPRLVQDRSPMPFARTLFPQGDRIRQHTLAHLQFMQRDLQRATRIGGVRQTNVGGTASRLHRSLDLIQTVGAYSTFKMLVETASQQDSVITIRARTVYVGTRSVVLEDSLAPLAQQMDSYYQQLGTEFDNVMYPILTTNFGNPLAVDASLSGAGRITMLFTPAVATYFPNLEAFVTSCDFVTPAECPASNQTEVFYGTVPTVATTSDGSDPRYDESTPAGWDNEIRGTLIHEAKHITAFAEKYSRSPNPLFEESWLEEGTAQIASELYARGISGTTWKGGATFQETIRCEIYLCPGYSFTMYNHFGWLYDYETADNTLSPINPGYYDPTIYGSGWFLTRWAADAYASSEPSFFKALVQQVTTNGVSNLEARTGQPWSKMLGQWALALAGDHYPGVANPPGFLSWNTRDVFSGVAQLYPGLQPYPLYMPQYYSAPLSVPGSVAAGSAAFFDLFFGTKQSIGIRATATADLPHTTTLRLAVVRME